MRALVIVAAVILTAGPVARAQVPAPAPAAVETLLKEAEAAMMADPAGALARAGEALARLEAAGPAADTRAVSALWLQGEALNRMNRPEPAAAALDRGLELVAVLSPGAKLEADLRLARAAAFRALGDYGAALGAFQGAHDLYRDLGEGRKRAIALQQMGNIYRDAREYDRALHYNELAAEAFSGDAAFELARVNNVGNIYKDKGDYARAELGFRRALERAREMNSLLLEARILTNLGSVQILQGRPDEADRTAREGLALSSAEAPHGWEPFLWGVRAQAALARGDLSGAASMIERTFAGMDLATTPTPFSEFHATAHEIYLALGSPRRALEHMAARHRLEDEARELAADANLALKGAQFDFATQELQIANLRADRLAGEVELQKAQQRQRTVLFSAAAMLALVVFAGGSVHYLSMRRSRNAIRSVNESLRASNLSLEKALKAKSEFLATTSHEIRTPLNGILGMTQILMCRPALEPDIRDRVELLHNAGETMKAIVDDLLDVAKMEAGPITLERRVFDLSGTLRSVAQLWKENAEARGLEFAIDLDQCPRMVASDEQRIRQIVFNLLSNAVKFTDTGAVRLAARPDDADSSSGVIIEVSDTGCGIPSAEHEAIFEAFHQVDGGTTRLHGGTGLGLSICRSLATALGGRISVASHPGAGSVFTLRLPVDGLSAEAPAPQADPDAGALAPQLIVVTSNALHGSLIEGVLAEDTAAPAVVGTCEEARALIRAGGVQRCLLFASAAGGAVGDNMAEVLALRQCCESMELIVWIDIGNGLEPAMMRLAGADRVIEGEFDAFAAAQAMSGSADDHDPYAASAA
jgi:signal transduction histidine kinase